MKLGLIGKNIKSSQAPDIHRRLGKLFDIPLTYELFDLKDKNETDFAKLLSELKFDGFSGVNITFPFKEIAIKYADKVNKSAYYIKASNTLIFRNNVIAENTDYTGFLRNYFFHFKDTKPGKILLIGGGGVGRAITFALGSLGVSHIYLLEKDNERSNKLIDELRLSNINCSSIDFRELEDIINKTDGIVNCSPIGHFDFPGCPLGLFKPKSNHWIFDAVYTPAKTEFLKKAEKAGSKIISGIDLFIFQALDAFLLFSDKQNIKETLLKEINFLRSHYFKSLYK